VDAAARRCLHESSRVADCQHAVAESLTDGRQGQQLIANRAGSCPEPPGLRDTLEESIEKGRRPAAAHDADARKGSAVTVDGDDPAEALGCDCSAEVHFHGAWVRNGQLNLSRLKKYRRPTEVQPLLQ